MPTQKTLVYFDHERSTFYVQVLPDQDYDPDSLFASRLLRKADTYLFTIWENERGEFLSAEFALDEKFFELAEPPSTLAEDLAELERRTGSSGLLNVDLFWIATVVEALASMD